VREIKFRAWDKSSKAMCKVKQILKFDGNMHFILDNPNSDFWGNNYGCDINRIELMQYTGRHDINGKEVYEGDTVKAKDSYTGREFTGNIEFRDCSFCIVGDCVSNCRWMDYEVEVIGNVWENPELLKEG